MWKITLNEDELQSIVGGADASDDTAAGSDEITIIKMGTIPMSAGSDEITIIIMGTIPM